MATAVDRLAQRVKRLTRLAVELQELAVDVATDLAILRRTIADDASGRLDAAVEVALLRAARVQHQAALRAASVGASTMEMRLHRNGAAMVRIDEGKWFRLSKGDARLLRVLTHGSALAPDGFPNWQTYGQLADELARKAGVRPTHRALVESVYRVRRALKAADLNPYLLAVDRKAGRLRFLLRSGQHGAVARGYNSGDGRGRGVCDSRVPSATGS